MKNFILITALSAIFIGCKKSSSTTATSSSSSSTSSTATTINDSTTAVNALIGVWILDSTVQYNAGVAGATTYTVANVSNQTFTLSAAYYYPGPHPANYSLQMSYKAHSAYPPTATYWEVLKGPQYSSTGLMQFLTGVGVGGYIRILNSNKLVLSSGGGTVLQGQVYYYHK